MGSFHLPLNISSASRTGVSIAAQADGSWSSMFAFVFIAKNYKTIKKFSAIQMDSTINSIANVCRFALSKQIKK